MPSTRYALFALSLAVSTLTGCVTRYIPNTDVEDTDENRRIIAFCEKYRHAVEDKDVSTLVGLASPDYYEDGGNVDPADDMDYAGLKDYLAGAFQDARAINYEMRYRSISQDEDVIFVVYTIRATYRIPGTKGEEWHRKVEDNRLELIPYNGEYRIVGGM